MGGRVAALPALGHLRRFRSPIGTLTTLLVPTSYLFVSAGVFLAGVQLDELLRKQRSA